MKKMLFVLLVALTAGLSTQAQTSNHPRGREAFESLSPEQKTKVLEMKEKVKNMTPEQRRDFFAQNGGSHPWHGGNANRFAQLPAEKQAEIQAMKEKIKNMSLEERRAFFAQNGRPGGKRGG